MEKQTELSTAKSVPDLVKMKLGDAAITLKNLGAARQWAENRSLIIEGHTTVMQVKSLLEGSRQESDDARVTRQILAIALLSPEGITYSALDKQLKASGSAWKKNNIIRRAHAQALEAGAIEHIPSESPRRDAEPCIVATRALLLVFLDSGANNPITEQVRVSRPDFSHENIWSRFDTTEREYLEPLLDTYPMSD